MLSANKPYQYHRTRLDYSLLANDSCTVAIHVHIKVTPVFRSAHRHRHHRLRVRLDRMQGWLEEGGARHRPP